MSTYKELRLLNITKYDKIIKTFPRGRRKRLIHLKKYLIIAA